MTSAMQFTLLQPNSLSEAITMMHSHTGARFLAGGTDLVPNLRRGIGAPETLIALAGIKALHGISESEGYVQIGANVTLADLLQSNLPERFPAFLAAAEIASPALRQAATIGGNLCLDTRCHFYNQSKWWRQANQYCLKLDGDTCHVAPKGSRCHAPFSGDLAPALLVLGAEVQIANAAGARWQSLADLYVEDGLAHLNLAPADLLVAVRFAAKNDAQHSGYLKSRVRNAGDFPLAGVAVALHRQGNWITDLRVAVTGTNSRPLLFQDFDGVTGQKLNDDMLSRVSKHIGHKIKPMRTSNLSGLYRRQMVAVLSSRLIRELYERGETNG